MAQAVLISSLSLSVSAAAEAAAGAVDTLVIGELAADHNRAVDLMAFYAVHIHDNQAVIQQQACAGNHVGDQLLVGDADALIVAIIKAEAAVDDEFLAGSQLCSARLEFADAYFRSLHVGHKADADAVLLCGDPYMLRPLAVLRGRTVGKVQTDDVDTGSDQPVRISGDSEAGPRVATILVLRKLFT